MSVNLIPAFAVQQFATTVQLLLQQKGGRLRQSVMSGSHVGKQASPVDQIGKVEMKPVTSRFSPIERTDAPVDLRWVFPTDYDLSQLVDSFDLLKMIIDPQSPLVQGAVNAAGRQFDRLILAAINASNKTGVDAATSTALPSTQKVAVNYGASANTGLTVAKLIRAKEILMSNDVDTDTEEFFAIIKAKQHADLLREAQVVSSDFNGGNPVLVKGKVVEFLGIKLIHTELVESASSQDLIPVYAKSGVYLGIWQDMVTKISERDDLTGIPTQAYIKMSAGATRLEEKKVVQVTCA